MIYIYKPRFSLGAVLLADSAYGTRDWIIPPVRRLQQTAAEQRFNAAHRQTRRIVECAIGMSFVLCPISDSNVSGLCKQRFRGLLNGLRVKDTPFACQIVKAAFSLNNLALQYDPLQQDEINELLANVNVNDNIDVNAEDAHFLAQPQHLRRQAQLIATFAQL